VHVLIVLLTSALVIYLATSEELLSVGFVVEDHSKTSRHVDCLASLVEVYVLSAILASVAVDIIKLVTEVWL